MAHTARPPLENGSVSVTTTDPPSNVYFLSASYFTSTSFCSHVCWSNWTVYLIFFPSTSTLIHRPPGPSYENPDHFPSFSSMPTLANGATSGPPTVRGENAIVSFDLASATGAAHTTLDVGFVVALLYASAAG